MDGVTYTLEELSIGYHKRKQTIKLVDGICAHLPEGRMTCMLARNGAGKSTLLRTMAGFIPPVEGKALLANKPLGSFSPGELAKLVGVVLTDKIQESNLTAIELVAMGRMPYTGFFGELTRQDLKIVDDAVQMVGMQSFVNRRVSSLSDGELQKLVIAKTLAQQTSIILLDEPLAFLDFPSKITMLRLLRRLSHEAGKTILLSVHDLEIALQTADYLWVINPMGKLVQGLPAILAQNGDLDFFFQDEKVKFNRDSMQYFLLID